MSAWARQPDLLEQAGNSSVSPGSRTTAPMRRPSSADCRFSHYERRYTMATIRTVAGDCSPVPGPRPRPAATRHHPQRVAAGSGPRTLHPLEPAAATWSSNASAVDAERDPRSAVADSTGAAGYRQKQSNAVSTGPRLRVPYSVPA